MDPRSRKLLWDARDAAAEILPITGDVALDGYRRNRLLRLGVERLFSIVREALAALRRQDPETAQRVPEVSAIIGFRNVLVHNYSAVDDTEVWRFAREKLPPLHDALEAMLAADPPPGG